MCFAFSCLIPNVEKRVVLFESANVYLEEKKMEQYHARKQGAICESLHEVEVWINISLNL